MSNGYLVHPKLPKGPTVINGHVFIDGVLEIPAVKDLNRFVHMYIEHYGLLYAGEAKLKELLTKLQQSNAAPTQSAPGQVAPPASATASSGKKAEK